MAYNTNKIKVRGLFAVLFTAAILISSKLYAEDVFIKADKQNFNGQKAVFEGKVKVDYADIHVESPKAFVRNDETGKPISATFVDGAQAIRIKDHARNEVKANILNLSLLKNKIQAEGDSESFVFQDKKPMVHIKAGSQSFDIKENVITATTNVDMTYDKIKTHSDKAKITINKGGELDKVEFFGSVHIVRDNTIINAAQVTYNAQTDEMIAQGSTNSETTLDDTSHVAIWADLQQYDQKSKTLITSGNVKIKYKDYVATGPKATFIPDQGADKPNNIYFVGRSRIQQGERYVEADRIHMTMEPKNFNAEGNVMTKFTQVQGYENKPKEQKAVQ
jgi:lipopolysaccharide export system protein LptA